MRLSDCVSLQTHGRAAIGLAVPHNAKMAELHFLQEVAVLGRIPALSDAPPVTRRQTEPFPGSTDYVRAHAALTTPGGLEKVLDRYSCSSGSGCWLNLNTESSTVE